MKYRSFILLFSLLSIMLASCDSAVRKEWRQSSRSAQEKSPLSNPTLSMEERLAEIDKLVSVQEIKKDIKRYQKELDRAQIALHDKAQAERALGLLYLNQQAYAAAYQQFAQALKLSPANAMLHYYAGVSSGWMSNLDASASGRASYHEQALFHLTTAARLDPNHGETALALAGLYADKDETLDQALIQLRRYKSLHPGSMPAILVEARIATKERNFRLARELYQRVLTESDDKALQAQAQSGLSILP
jgi:tetratricopeptide (TPR) repeat protein